MGAFAVWFLTAAADTWDDDDDDDNGWSEVAVEVTDLKDDVGWGGRFGGPCDVDAEGTVRTDDVGWWGLLGWPCVFRPFEDMKKR